MFPKLKKTPEQKPFLPYGRQVIEDDDIAAVTDVLKSPFLTTGPKVQEFEKALASYVGAEEAVVVSNGTAALHLAAWAIGLQPGDQVIVPAVTFVATANAPRYLGADIIFADVAPDTGLMRPEDLKNAISKADPDKLKAVFNVHLGGQTEDLETICDIAQINGLKLIDDACHAIGTSFKDRHGRNQKVGANALSDLTVFSFHPVKTIAMGEGGAVTTKDPALAAELRALRSHGITHTKGEFKNLDLAFEGGSQNPWYHELQQLGVNYRATDLQCALGTSQIKKADRFIQQRRKLISTYDELLAPLAPKIVAVTRHAPDLTGWHLSVALFDFAAIGKTRAQVIETLKEQGIGTQVHYIPVPLQPFYQDLYGKPEIPGAMAYYERCLSLPLAADMTEADVARVVEALKTL